MPSNWYLMNPSYTYHSGDELNEMNEYAMDGFDELLYNSPEACDVIIDDQNLKAIVQTGKRDNQCMIHTHIGTLSHGKLIVYKSVKWIVVSRPVDNKIHETARIELCNNTLHIKTSETKTQTGIDSMGRPVYTTTPVYSDFPCIVSSSKSAGYDSNQTINLPSGQLFITIPYTEAIKEGMEFTMYQQKYKVKNVDYSESMNQVGLVTLTVERFV